jgi:hypothetical protein
MQREFYSILSGKIESSGVGRDLGSTPTKYGPQQMPHFLVLKKSKPLSFEVREGSVGKPPFLATIQLTRVADRPLHAQPCKLDTSFTHKTLSQIYVFIIKYCTTSKNESHTE